MKLIKSEPRFVCFAPIDLKDATIYFVDGFGNGTFDAPTADGAHSSSDTTISIAKGTMSQTVPASSVLRIAGDNTKYVVQSAVVDATGQDEVQSISANGASAGTWTMTLSLPKQTTTYTTAAIAYNAAAAAIQSAVDAALAGAANGDGVTYTAGDITVANASSADLAATTLTYDGASTAKNNVAQVTTDLTGLTGPSGGAPSTTTPGAAAGSTDSVVISPGLTTGLSGGEALTFSGRELEVKLGEGNFTYDETREVEFIRNRGTLDTYRLGDEQPLDVSFDFTWEFLSSIAGAATPTIEEVLKQTGPASSWVSSFTADPCAAYVVDIRVENAPNCASVLPEVILLPYFIYTSLSHDSDAAQVSVTGQCNSKQAVLSRPTYDL